MYKIKHSPQGMQLSFGLLCVCRERLCVFVWQLSIWQISELTRNSGPFCCFSPFPPVSVLSWSGVIRSQHTCRLFAQAETFSTDTLASLPQFSIPRKNFLLLYMQSAFYLVWTDKKTYKFFPHEYTFSVSINLIISFRNHSLCLNLKFMWYKNAVTVTLNVHTCNLKCNLWFCGIIHYHCSVWWVNWNFKDTQITVLPF